VILYIRYCFRSNIFIRKSNRYQLEKNVSLIKIPSSGSSSSFSGYYNITPWNVQWDIIFYETDSEKTIPSLKSKLKIKVLRRLDNKVHLLSKTTSWNWQQGAFLQWFGNGSNKIIYNVFSLKDNEYYSETLDLNTMRKRKFCMPIYSVSRDSRWALTLNFSRLAKMRPDYGYFNKKGIIKFDDTNDGIWKIDLEENSSKLLITLEELKDFNYVDSMFNAKSKVNHIDIAPNGERFMFLHRWFKNGVKYSRLLTADLDGKNLHELISDDMVSHCIWKNDSQILSFCRVNGVGEKYFLFTDKTRKYMSYGEKYLNLDGHPSFSPDGKWLITDTYPSKKTRRSSLILYNEENDVMIKVGEFFQPIKFNGQARCDLHPKWSLDGKFISIDSSHSGKRAIYILDVSSILSKSKKKIKNTKK